MRKRMCVAAVAALGVGVFAGLPAGASAKPAPNKNLCKHGGYALAPLDVLGFTNPGQCMVYFNQGGTVPVPVPQAN